MDKKKALTLKIQITKILVIIAAITLSADFIYKTIKDITAMTKEKCILYLSLPKAGFLIYEYFIELFFVVLIGVYIAVVLEAWFSKFKKYYPKNPVTAFLYASVIPVCSCTVIPIVKSMDGKINMRTMISFIISAPLLSPYIIVLSFSVLGVKYGILRILCSLFLAITTGYILELFNKKEASELELKDIPLSKKSNGSCPIIRPNKFFQTYNIMKSIFPFLIIAGVLGMVAELYMPVHFLENMDFKNNYLDLIIVILIGIPMYYCNGADVVLLRPLMHHSGLALGTAMAFSLTSTAVCITAIIMLVKFLNRRLTAILVGSIIIITFLIGYVINMFS